MSEVGGSVGTLQARGARSSRVVRTKETKLPARVRRRGNRFHEHLAGTRRVCTRMHAARRVRLLHEVSVVALTPRPPWHMHGRHCGTGSSSATPLSWSHAVMRESCSRHDERDRMICWVYSVSVRRLRRRRSIFGPFVCGWRRMRVVPFAPPPPPPLLLHRSRELGRCTYVQGERPCAAFSQRLRRTSRRRSRQLAVRPAAALRWCVCVHSGGTACNAL